MAIGYSISYEFRLRARRVCRHARHANVPFDVVAYNDRLPTLWRRDVNALKMDTIAGCAGTTCQIRNHIPRLPTTRAVNVDEIHVRDVYLTGILRASCPVYVEVALIQHNRSIRVLNVHVLVRDIVNVAVAHIWTSPGFEPCPILAVEQCDVFEPRVGNIVFDTRVLANGAHRDAVRAVAPEVLDEDVGCIGLGGEAVVTDVDAGIGDGQAIDVEGVEAVCVFGEGLWAG